MFWSKKRKARDSANVELDRNHTRSVGVGPDEVFGKLRDFVVARTQLADGAALSHETRLFSSGLLDSLAYAELVYFVEESMGIVLSDHGDVTMDRLDRLGDAVDLIVGASS